MRQATLTRLDQGDQGTFGRLVADSGLTLYTGELPWRDNQPELSCIPTGVYTVVWTYSNAFRRFMYLITGVEKRAGCRVHPANFMGDVTKGYRAQLHGCIVLGERLGIMGGQKAVLIAAPAVGRFERDMAQAPFKLEIVNG